MDSTTLVPNLNADMVDGKNADDFVLKTGDTMTGNLTVPTLTATGNLVLPMTTATTGIIKEGGNTLIHTYGSGNFFAGTSAGNLTMTGNYNTAAGATALAANSTGNYNTASGYRALYANTTGITTPPPAWSPCAVCQHRGQRQHCQWHVCA